MAIKIYKRNTAGRRNMSKIVLDEVDIKKPEKSLLRKSNYKAGRSKGKISVRFRGGRVKRQYRVVDFKMNKFDIPGTVVAIERDPNRGALIALVNYADGEKRYVLAVKGLKKGDQILSGEKSPIKEGNRLPLKKIPVGTFLSNVEFFPGGGGQIARGAGNFVTLQAIDGGKATLKMASGEIRTVQDICFATIGQVSNFEHNSYRIGKAGRRRYMGWRPSVRGTAMNPVDHPHGGGEGCQPIGLKYPKTPWGKPALGKKTRKKGKYSDKFILKRRVKRK